MEFWKCLEYTWNKILPKVNGYFYKKNLAELKEIACTIKDRISYYMRENGYTDFTVFVSEDVRYYDGIYDILIRVEFLKPLDFDSEMGLWEKLEEVGFRGIDEEKAFLIGLEIE